jgi:actin-like ATPase involved in cell morphogenesis
MASKRPERKNQKLLGLIREQYQPELAQDIQEALKNLTSGMSLLI